MKMARLIPMLPVKSMPASVEFYQKLGFTVERRQDDWGWAMLRFDDCRLMVDQSINTHRLARVHTADRNQIHGDYGFCSR
jgi:predicted lactoylglutathione lyase